MANARNDGLVITTIFNLIIFGQETRIMSLL